MHTGESSGTWPRFRACSNKLERDECAITPGMAAALKAPLADYLRRFAYDTIALDARYLRHVIETVGADRFVLGSDRPFTLGDPDPVGSVRALDLPAADRDAICAGNACRLLRIKRQDAQDAKRAG